MGVIKFFNNKKNIIVFGGTLVVLFFSCLPLWLSVPNGYISTGYIIGGQDYMTFLGKMKWGAAGHWTYINRFTPEITESVPIYPFYLFLGHLAKWLGLSLPVMFHLARIIFGTGACILLWNLIRCKECSKGVWLPFLLGVWATSGGLIDFLGTVASRGDVFLQGHTYLALFAFPHYSLDLIAYCFIFYAYLSTSQNKWLKLSLAAAGGFILSAVHPFLLLLVLSVPCVHALLFDRTLLKRALLIGLVGSAAALPLVILQAKAFAGIHWLQIWREQCSYKPSLKSGWVLLMGCYGVVGVLGWYKGIKALLQRGSETFWTTWLVCTSLLALMMPLNNRLEYLFFISTPLGILAAKPITLFYVWLKKLEGPNLVKNIIFCSLLILSVWQGIFTVVEAEYLKRDHKHIMMLPREYVEGLKWLEAHSKPDDVALTTIETGNILPAYTLQPRPYIGHSSETMYFKSKSTVVNKIFNIKSVTNKNMIYDTGARWLVVDKWHHEKVPDFSSILGKPTFKNKYLTIWEIDAG